MEGRFSALKPDPDAGVSVWKEHESLYRELLQEINNEVFEGQGQIQNTATFYGIYQDRRLPSIRHPYVSLNTKKGLILISPSTDLEVQITYESSGRYPYLINWRFCSPDNVDQLVENLKTAVRFILR